MRPPPPRRRRSARGPRARPGRPCSSARCRARRVPRSGRVPSQAGLPERAIVRRARALVHTGPRARLGSPASGRTQTTDRLGGASASKAIARSAWSAAGSRLPCIQKAVAMSISASAALPLSPTASRASRASASRSRIAAAALCPEHGPTVEELRPARRRAPATVEGPRRKSAGRRRPRRAPRRGRRHRAAHAGPTRSARLHRARPPPPTRAPAGSGGRASRPGPRGVRATRSTPRRADASASAPHAGSGRRRRRG